MMFKLSATAVTLLAATVTAIRANPRTGKSVITRPDIQALPLSPGTPHAISPVRDSRLCFVNPSTNTTPDDAPAILAAFQECNNGGTVVLDANYTIASPLDLTFLNSVDLAISGIVNFSGDVDYWVDNTFKYAYQASSTFWKFGGTDVVIYGNGVGVINGNGQPWYDAFATNATLLRPILLVLDGVVGGAVSGLVMKNSPNWFNLIANSSDIIVSDIHISVEAGLRLHHIVPVACLG